MTFNSPAFKKVYELLSKSWMTEEELRAQVNDESVPVCIQILKKGNLVEEQWRMPKPGKTPQGSSGEPTTSSGQISSATSRISRLSCTSRSQTTKTSGKLSARSRRKWETATRPFSDLSRKFGVNPVSSRGLQRGYLSLNVKGQGLVLLNTGRKDSLYSILRSKREVSRLQILVEIAEHQPAVRQQEIANKLGVTPQAISEYIRCSR